MTTRAAQFELIAHPLLDPNTGQMASAYTVEFYAAGTSTPKNVWTEKEKSNPYTTYTLDASGKALLYGDGIYKIIVKNTAGAAVLTLDNQKIQATTYSVSQKIGTYTATPDDDALICDGTFTLNLADVATFEHPLTVIPTDGSTITINPYSTQTVAGDLTLAVTKPVMLFPDTTSGVWRTDYTALTSDDIPFTPAGTGAVPRTVQSKLRDHVSVKDFGAVGDGTTDDTAAIQAAVDAHPSVYVPPGVYKITATLDQDTNNRFHFFGAGQTTIIAFSPSTNTDNLFSVSGNKDNCLFENMHLIFTNASSKHSAGGVDIDNTCNTINFRRVTFEDFDEFAIRADSAQNIMISECRFVDIDNSALDDHLAQAIRMTTYSNNVTIEKCRFSSCDQAIRLETTGNANRIINCSFEANGDSGNTAGGMTTVYVSGQVGFVFSGNYVEDNVTDLNYFFARFEACICPVISNNALHGDWGGTTHTHTMLYFDSDCLKPVVFGNLFSEILTAFMRSDGALVNAYNNKYIDGGAHKTAYNDIMALFTNPAYFQLDTMFSFTWDVGSLSDTNGVTSSEQAVTGLVFGDIVLVSAGVSLADMIATAYVNSTGNAQVRVQNESGDTHDLASTTWRLKIIKAQ